MALVGHSSRRFNSMTAARRRSLPKQLRGRIWKGSTKSKSRKGTACEKISFTLSTCGGSDSCDVSSEYSPNFDDTSGDPCMGASNIQNALTQFRAVVINLDRRPDRMEACANSCSIQCPGLQYTRLPAADGRKEDIPLSEVGMSWYTGTNCVYQKMRSVRKGWNDLDNYVPRELRLSAGERGCSMSHIRAWRHCIELNRPLIVLEDDAMLMPDFTPVLSRALTALPADAQLLYLGYSQAAPWRRELSAELVESEYVWTTVGYIVWPSGAHLLLSQLPVSQPVDNWMASFAAANRLKAYAVRPKIVRQAEEWNVMSDVVHSDEALAHTMQAVASTSDGRIYLSHDTHHSVDLWSQAGVNQEWSIGKTADGLYTIRTCATTQGGRVYLSHDTHQTVDLWSEAGMNQRWIVKAVDVGVYTIQTSTPTSTGKTYLGCNGSHGVELFADSVVHRWKIPDSAFEI